MAELYQTFTDEHGNPSQIEPVGSGAGSNVRRRRLSPAQDWFKRGMIDKAMLAAATRLSTDWEESALKPRYTASSLSSERTGGAREAPDRWFLRQKAASLALLAAIEAVPPRARFATQALIAEELSVKEHASGGIQGATARTLALIGLDALVLHYDRMVAGG